MACGVCSVVISSVSWAAPESGAWTYLALEEEPVVAPGASPASNTSAGDAPSNVDANGELVEGDEGWVDETHEYVSESADNLANWIDHFFGTERDDIESADSNLRLTFDNEWEESEGHDTAIRLRGKVHLPRVNERLSLIFTDEDGRTEDEEQADDLVENNRQTTRVSLQYKAKESDRHRLDYRIGVKRSLKFKTSARYRYMYPTSDKLTHRITETAYFVDGEGFGLRNEYDLDYLISDNRLFRWSNDATFAEDTDGVEWSSRLILGTRSDEKSAVSSFAWTRGQTRPIDWVTSYGVGIRYRQNFLRPWLFYELEPAYAWVRDEPEDPRDGRLIFSIKLEIMLERKAEMAED